MYKTLRLINYSRLAPCSYSTPLHSMLIIFNLADNAKEEGLSDYGLQNWDLGAKIGFAFTTISHVHLIRCVEKYMILHYMILYYRATQFYFLSVAEIKVILSYKSENVRYKPFKTISRVFLIRWLKKFIISHYMMLYYRASRSLFLSLVEIKVYLSYKSENVRYQPFTTISLVHLIRWLEKYMVFHYMMLYYKASQFLCTGRIRSTQRSFILKHWGYQRSSFAWTVEVRHSDCPKKKLAKWLRDCCIFRETILPQGKS